MKNARNVKFWPKTPIANMKTQVKFFFQFFLREAFKKKNKLCGNFPPLVYNPPPPRCGKYPTIKIILEIIS